MSSPPNEPYKSRLLNLINRYYIKLNDQVNVKFRELGYAVQGGLQKAFLPFFWLWQSGTKIGQVFTSSSSSNSSLPVSDDRDNITIQTCEADNLIELVHQNITENPLFTSLLLENFQGLASSLKNKYIVVIVKNNKVKNIIPKVKQEDIKFLINNTFKNNQVVQKTKRKSFGRRFLSFFKNFNSRSKRRKQSQNQGAKTSVSNSQSIVVSKQSTKIVSIVDYLFSQFEKLIIPNNENQKLLNNMILEEQQINDSKGKQKQLSGQNSPKYSLPAIKNKVVRQLVETSNHRLQEVLPIVKTTTAKMVVKGVDKIQLATQNLNKSIEEDPFQIRILILEAMNYFFNKDQSKLLKTSINKKLSVSLNQNDIIIIEDEVTNPWLSWEDLYNVPKSLPNDNLDSISSIKNSLIEETLTFNKDVTTKIDQTKTVKTKIDRNDEIIKEPEIIVTCSESTQSSQATPTKMTIASVKNVTIQKAKKTQVKPLSKVKKVEKKVVEKEVNNDWNKVKQEAIEAKVIEVKYEKHLLEITLEKLDQLILWLEEIFLKLIAFVKVAITEFNNKKN